MSSKKKLQFPHGASTISMRVGGGGGKNKLHQVVSGPLSSTRNRGGSKVKKGGRNHEKVTSERVEPLTLSTTNNATRSSKDYLTSFKDNTSSYESVRKSCLYISQFGGGGGGGGPSSPTVDMEGIAKSALFHDESFADSVSSMLKALMDCIRDHDDRRCRIVACKTIAILARAAYARIRHTPLLFSIRDSTIHQLEDEIMPDVPVVLSTTVLNDVDDGVSACAMEALGLLTLSTCSVVGTLVDDELAREIDAICNNRSSPYSPSLMDVSDEDISIPQMELQIRIYDNVISPRLFRLVRRIVCYESSIHYKRILPFLTSCLTHVVQTNPATTYGVDRTINAKRWMEVDVASIIHDVVYLILLPSMQSTYDADVAHAAAISGIRLAHVCPNAPWMPEVCEWVVVVLAEDLSSSTEVMEHKTATMASLLISLRAIPISERSPYLDLVANELSFLPSTTNLPISVTSAGVIVEHDSGVYYRRPARIGFLSEIALSLFVDGPTENSVENNDRSDALEIFLTSRAVNLMISSRSGMEVSVTDSCETSASEELVLSFCMVASAIGQSLMTNQRSQQPTPRDYYNSERQEWLRCSLKVLSIFSACLYWRTSSLEDAEDEGVLSHSSMTTAAQAAYVQLLLECMFVVGLIDPVPSVSIHMMPRTTPPRSVVLEQLSHAVYSLTDLIPMSSLFEFSHETLNKLMDQLLGYTLSEGVLSRHLHLTLLALLTDHWVQQRHLETSQLTSNEEGNISNISLDEVNAREILSYLATEISSFKTFKKRTDEKNNTNNQYLLVCIACAENIALTACDIRKRFGKNAAKTSSSPERIALIADIEEVSNDIISAVLTTLCGKNHLNGDANGDRSKNSYLQVKSCCEEAKKRIASACESAKLVEEDTAWGLKDQTALFSSLVLVNGDRNGVSNGDMNNWASTPTHDKRSHGPGNVNTVVRYPLVSPNRNSCLSLEAKHPFVQQEYSHSFLSLYCRQAVLARINASILSSPLLDGPVEREAETSKEFCRERPRNWLRLKLPSPPNSRRHHMMIGPGDRLCWNNSVSTVLGSSDPVSLMLAFAVRRQPRYDYEAEYKPTVTLRMYNTTAVEIANGVRMRLGVSSVAARGGSDLVSKQITKVLDSHDACSHEESATEEQNGDLFASSATVVYKQAVKPGDFVTWEVTLETLPNTGRISLHPSVTFREIDSEPTTSTWAGLSTTTTRDNKEKGDENIVPDNTLDCEDEVKDGVTLDGEPVTLSPLAVFQPCPLVFFLGDGGDVNVFRFLWFNLPYKIPSLQLSPIQSKACREGNVQGADELGVAIASMSSIRFPEDSMMKGWALSDSCGKKVLCVLVAPTGSAGMNCTLHVKGDNKDLLLLLCGSKAARLAFVYALTSIEFDSSLVAQSHLENNDAVANVENDNKRIEI